MQRYIVFGKYANKKGIFFGNYILFHPAVTLTDPCHKEGKHTVKYGTQQIKITYYSKKTQQNIYKLGFYYYFYTRKLFYLNINH